MSIEAILQAIHAAADEESAAILRDADAEAEAIREAARAAAAALVEAALERDRPGAISEKSRIVNAARLRLGHARAAGEAGLEAAVHAAAGVELERIAGGADPARWGSALARLANDALEGLGSGATVEIRARDADAVVAVAVQAGACVVLLPPDAAPGLVARSADGALEVDARLATRLARARVVLADQVWTALRASMDDASRGDVTSGSSMSATSPDRGATRSDPGGPAERTEPAPARPDEALEIAGTAS